MSSRAGVRVIVALVAVVVGAGALSLFRPGYSPDEEFTLFAVRGIRAHGLPLLPSGLLYDRGLVYAYLSWLAAALTGVELPAFRALSLLSAAGALVLGYALVRRLASPAAGVVSALLVAVSMPFWAVATTGRFYAPFLLVCVAILEVVRLRSPDGGAGFGETSPSAPPRSHPHLSAPGRTRLALAALAFLARLTHELAFTLMAIPAAGLILSWREGRLDETRGPLRLRHRRNLWPWMAVSTALAAGLIAAQSVLMGLHFLMPPSDGGSTMIQRFFLWQVLNLFERPQGAPLGVVCAGLVVAWLLVPARAAFSLIVASWGAAAVLAMAVALAAGTTPVSVGLVQGVVASSLAYPLDMFWHLGGTRPVMVWMAMALLVARLCGAGGAWPAGERAAHLGWVGWALWFGVIESGITINYVLLPTVCMLAAIGIDLVAIGQHTAALWPGRRALVLRAILEGAAMVVAADQWSGTGGLSQRLAAARPTIEVEGIEAVRSSLQPTDRVACTDELACLLLVGRVDAWLALDDYVRERFLVIRGSQGVGVYAGAPAVFSPAYLFDPDPGGIEPARVIVVDVLKEYPVGNSRTWLPRALAADRLEFRSLLRAPQARVGEIVAPSGFGRARRSDNR